MEKYLVDKFPDSAASLPDIGSSPSSFSVFTNDPTATEHWIVKGSFLISAALFAHTQEIGLQSETLETLETA